LTDGKFEQGAPGSDEYISITVTDFTARGDLDGDGLEEYAALVAENYGGTGVFVFLVVFSDVDGRLIFQTSIGVDDRPNRTNSPSRSGRSFWMSRSTERMSRCAVPR
jgi:hypothetical protein